MSYEYANGNYVVRARDGALKIYTGNFTTKDGADPTVLNGEGFRVKRAEEGVWTVTLDEALTAVRWAHAHIRGQTVTQHTTIDVAGLGDEDEGASFTVTCGTVSVPADDGATPEAPTKTNSDEPDEVVEFCIIGIGPSK